MENEKIKAQVIYGSFGSVMARIKAGIDLEIGEILVAEPKKEKVKTEKDQEQEQVDEREKEGEEKILLQVYDLKFSSQESSQNLEQMSGWELEHPEAKTEIFMKKTRLYNLALLKNLLLIKEGRPTLGKKLPKVFSLLRSLEARDLDFLRTEKDELFLGYVRSGSKNLGVKVFIDGKKMLTHHVLIAATTGRGKSNLAANLLWNLAGNDYAGVLVLDPHDEYYGKNKFGLKNHKVRENIIYYTPNNPPVGARSLVINLRNIRPQHLTGVVQLSDPQQQAIYQYYKEFGQNWVKSLIQEKEIEGVKFYEGTITVVRRKLMSLLDLGISNGNLVFRNIFTLEGGEGTVRSILEELEEGRIVIVDTSNFSGAQELLIGSLLAAEVLKAHKFYKKKGILEQKPVISILLEEAPRVLGKEVLERGPNIFSNIAKEGRKFKIGLVAITQLPSVIPKEVLANMNTKIILGMEMKPERQAIIDSAAQDLSEDDKSIASLDIGEAMVTSNFLKFATPLFIPKFEDYAQGERGKSKNKGEIRSAGQNQEKIKLKAPKVIKSFPEFEREEEEESL